MVSSLSRPARDPQGRAVLTRTRFPSCRVARAPAGRVFLSRQRPLHLASSLPWSLVESGDSLLLHVTVWVGACAQGHPSHGATSEARKRQKGFALTSALAAPVFTEFRCPQARIVSLSSTVCPQTPSVSSSFCDPLPSSQSFFPAAIFF